MSDVEDIRPDGEDCLRQGRGLLEAQPFGYGQGVPGVGQGVFGIAAAGQEGGDPVAAPPALHAIAHLHDLARDLQPQGLRRPRRRRIVAQPLQHVGPVHARGLHRDEDLTGARLGPVDADDLQRLGRALAAPDAHRGHGLWHGQTPELALSTHGASDRRRSKVEPERRP